jgi:hypothetical protein
MDQRLILCGVVWAHVVKHCSQQTGLVRSQIVHEITPITFNIEQTRHVTIAACLLPVYQVEL